MEMNGQLHNVAKLLPVKNAGSIEQEAVIL